MELIIFLLVVIIFLFGAIVDQLRAVNRHILEFKSTPKGVAMKTKNNEFWLDAWVHFYRWVILFELDMESIDKDFTEISLTVLCFTLTYTRMTRSFLDKLKK